MSDTTDRRWGLGSLLDELRGEDLSSLGDAEIEAEVVALREGIEALEGEWLRRLSEVERRQTYRRDGILSATSFLVHRLRMGAGRAKGMVSLARSLRAMPGAGRALGTGRISLAHARVLAQAAEAHPSTYAEHEGTLLEAAATLSVSDLHRVVAHWRQAQDEAEALGDWNEAWERRRVHLSRTFGGAWRLDGELDPEGGEILATALGALGWEKGSSPGRPDTPAQRRADALVDLARDFLDSGRGETQGGEVPHLTVVVDLEVLERRTGRTLTGSGGTLHPEAARRLSCDAGVSRVVTRGRSEPLDVGRRTRTVPAVVRRALAVRDGGCAFPGCDRPPRWCDAHHLLHWSAGGPTALWNLVLLCRRHHRMLHEGGYSVRMEEGRLVFRRPDGTVLSERGPPGH